MNKSDEFTVASAHVTLLGVSAALFTASTAGLFVALGMEESEKNIHWAILCFSSGMSLSVVLYFVDIFLRTQRPEFEKRKLLASYEACRSYALSFGVMYSCVVGVGYYFLIKNYNEDTALAALLMFLAFAVINTSFLCGWIFLHRVSDGALIRDLEKVLFGRSLTVPEKESNPDEKQEGKGPTDQA